MKTLIDPGEDSKNRTATGQSVALPPSKKRAKLSRTHQDFWVPRLKKRDYTDRKGKTVQIPDWQVRLFHAGREGWFNLGTPNQAAAAAKARDIFVFLKANGWEAALAKFKPTAEFPAVTSCTVGEFIDEVKAVSGLKPGTYEIYARKFRSLVAGVFNLHGDASKHDYVTGGHQKWLNRVHAVRLNKLTSERVNKWKVRELRNASSSPLELKHANVTLRSILLSSKALFSPKVRRHLTVRVPAILPFDGVALPEVGKSRYKSEINPALLLQQAQRELAEGWQGEKDPPKPRPELFKIVLLALGAGLRRDEIDTLQWKQIQWHRNAIVIETTEHTGTKSADSEADVDVDPGLLEILKSYMPKPGQGSPFVIESPIQPRPNATSYHHYRCSRLFRELVAWLRSKGINARNALHSLRKEFGSQICAQAGIYAASTALRHSSITLTRDYYVDKKQPVVFQVSRLLQQASADPETSKSTAA
jgi:integrase